MNKLLLILFSIFLSLPIVVQAQEVASDTVISEESKEVSVKGDTLENNFDLIPVEVWHYGEVGPEFGDSCIFSNVYNNGFAIQVSEDNEYIKAFIIDFAQPVFAEGQLYPFILMINGAPAEVRGLAVSTSSIRFNLTKPLETEGFEAYTTNSIIVKTEEAEFRFALTGLSEVLKNINGCIFQTEEERLALKDSLMADINNPMPKKKPVTKKADEASEQTKAVEEKIVEKEDVLYPLIPIVDEETVTVVRAKAPELTGEITDEERKRNAAQKEAEELLLGKMKPTATPIVTDAPKEIVKKDTAPKIWEAKKGERLSDVIARWSDQQGVKVKWQANVDPKLNEDVTSLEPFEEAVAKLLKTTGLDMDARIKDTVPVDQKAVQEWRALDGMNLQTLLKNWSEKAGVTLVWKAPMEYNVKQEYKDKASYAGAVQAVLDQFKDSPERPVAQLNADPNTGEITLIVTKAEKT
ncbi:MAG: hypothetical protein CMH30_00365 [Micavibrio sp.]|nr:hypothetical protein [Micavibrio sp.]|tara:strand:+ start:39 stop:1436 length:1398 start_codon:yes stop_codon:yes gene_type:complete